jgi:transposase
MVILALAVLYRFGLSVISAHWTERADWIRESFWLIVTFTGAKMRQQTRPLKDPAEKVVQDIRRATRKHYSAEDKIRIVLEGLRGEDSIAELCRREGIAQNLYYRWSGLGVPTMPWRAIKAATRDAAVYLNIELIGGSLLKMKSLAQGRAKVCDECQWWLRTKRILEKVLDGKFNLLTEDGARTKAKRCRQSMTCRPTRG